MPLPTHSTLKPLTPHERVALIQPVLEQELVDKFAAGRGVQVGLYQRDELYGRALLDLLEAKWPEEHTNLQAWVFSVIKFSFLDTWKRVGRRMNVERYRAARPTGTSKEEVRQAAGTLARVQRACETDEERELVEDLLTRFYAPSASACPRIKISRTVQRRLKAIRERYEALRAEEGTDGPLFEDHFMRLIASYDLEHA